ncbi:6-phosphofructokinase [Thermoanaerobacterium thermosaccharolyticum]|uniref:6-phosphofructokinase n=1 Tax=Thermoanaerobacterium thermosaccharolyticum TaxID=1517 RepID=UPI00177E7FB0|nr:6-phosphofructokinase [Thermoanaerobacterium thermosaccharolyticum]MBE0068727.1 6-phosphofructokinase [Thermoanaerobacterium thermosaccharolyticum]MBE0228656.1 6-phosphofructokinase [Thermoanaerobacterium thermosaccharolyticum]
MEMIKGNLLIAQSGGPTSVINASAYGAIKEFISLASEYKVYAGLYGIEGILEDRIIDINTMDKNTIESLKYMTSSAFGSCRYKLEDYDVNEEEYKKILNIFKKYNIRYFLYIGGNDSMDTANKLNIYMNKIDYDVNIIGVPKTIDNDLAETDHCPGFGSAAKYVANACIEIWSDINAYKKESIVIVEVMGRDAGWIAASTGILKSIIPNVNQLIYLPEISFEKSKFLIDVENAIKKNNKLLIVVSEGIKDENGEYINKNIDETDSFGHKRLGGAGKHLQDLVKKNITKNVKLIKLGILQRCAIHCASKTDVDESEMVGRDSVKYAIAGYSGYMTAITRLNNDKYKCKTDLVKLQDVSNRVKNVPLNWINKEGNGMKDEIINYVQPLILGEVNPFNENGLVKYINMNELDRNQ